MQRLGTGIAVNSVFYKQEHAAVPNQIHTNANQFSKHITHQRH